jgi:hypothetical protein
VTPFRFEAEFQAPSTAVVFAAYFDADHIADQDRRVEIARREVLELDDNPSALRRVCKVVPRRQLPAILRPFVPGELHYIERLVWRKADDAIDMQIEPSLLGGRTDMHAVYALSLVGPGRVRRVYEGSVHVELRLVGKRIERTIVEDLEASLIQAAQGTQAYLDSHGLRS